MAPDWYGYEGETATVNGVNWKWVNGTWQKGDYQGDISEQDLHQAYRDSGGGLSFAEWLRAGKPTTPVASELKEPSTADQLDYQNYRGRGGRLSYDNWVAKGKPSYPGDEVTVTDPGVTDPGVTEPEPDPDVTGGEEDFSQQLAAAVRVWQEEQRRVGALQTAEAQRLGARDIGKMSRMAQQALLYQGRTPAEIEQLTAGGMEAGARSLSDLVKQINLQTQQQVAGAQQYGIGTMISGEELGIRQREMAMAGGQFQQSLAEQVRQFNAAQAQQAGQYGQYMAQRKAEQPAWWEAPVSAFTGGLGKAVGSWATGKFL